MPREVKAYACKFRCGRNVTTKKKSIIEHEKRCFGNPETRSCKACKFLDKELNYLPNCGYMDENKHHPMWNIHTEEKPYTTNCKYWQNKMTPVEIAQWRINLE